RAGQEAGVVQGVVWRAGDDGVARRGVQPVGCWIRPVAKVQVPASAQLAALGGRYRVGQGESPAWTVLQWASCPGERWCCRWAVMRSRYQCPETLMVRYSVV